MAEAERLGLYHRLDLDQRGRAAHLFEHRRLAASFQRALEHEVFDEVRDDAVLAFRRDDDQPFGARFGRLGGHQFDAWRVDDRQQLLRHRLGGRQEPCPQPSGRDDRRARYRYQRRCHRSHINGIGCVKPLKATFRRFCGVCQAPVIVDAVTGPTKTELRAEILLARRALAPQLHDAEADALCEHLPAFIGGGETVCAYVPIGSEPGSAELIDSLLRRGVRVLLPVARHDEAGLPVPLQWGEYRPGGLVQAPFRACASPPSPGCPPTRSRPPRWCWCRRSRSTGPGCGWGAARVSTTARCRWPLRRRGWWPWSATTSSSTGCPPNRTTCG